MDENQEEPVVLANPLRKLPSNKRKPRNEPRAEPREEAGIGHNSEAIVVQGRNGEILTRSRMDNLDRFDVPVSFVPKGWSYQWNAVSTYGNKDIFIQQNNEFHRQGWRPVEASRHDGFFMPHGHEGPILVGGQMLMERPRILTDEAQDEAEQRAKQQMRDRDAALMGGRAGFREAMRGGFEMGGRYRGTGGDLKMSIDPGLDIPKPSYEMPND